MTPSSSAEPDLALRGVTVVSVEQAVAVPFATRQLAEMGARVIKVERPGEGDFARGYDEAVDGLSSYFVWCNRSKESLTLDLKAPQARAILSSLLDGADVFIQNLAPGAASRLGLSAVEVRAARPRLIVCDLSGYGTTGPYRDKKAYDLLIQAEAGLLSVTGTEEEPAKVGISVADIAAGMNVLSSILSALLLRERTGEGAAIEVSLFGSLVEWMSQPLYYSRAGTAPERTGTTHATIAPYGRFDVGDGTAVLFGIQNEREWTRFCDLVLEQPLVALDERFSTNAGRVAERQALSAIIEAAFATARADEVRARLDAAEIANAVVTDIADLEQHPQLADPERWCEVASPVGPITMLAPPVRLNGASGVVGPIPAVGEHTAGILGSLGYDSSALAKLRAAGVI